MSTHIAENFPSRPPPPSAHANQSIENQQNAEEKEVKKKDITEKVKTLKDAINILGEYDKDVVILKKLTNLNIHEDIYSKLLAEQSLIVIIKALNENWKPDWNNKNQKKYYPIFEMGGSSGFRLHDFVYWYSHSAVGSQFIYKSEELMRYGVTQFIDLYKSYML